LKFLTWFHNPTQWISLLQNKKIQMAPSPTLLD
jgi:hypothetical protein